MRCYRRFSPARIRMRLGIVRTVGEVAPTLCSSFVLAPREHVRGDSAARANMCPARRCVAVTSKRWRPSLEPLHDVCKMKPTTCTALSTWLSLLPGKTTRNRARRSRSGRLAQAPLRLQALGAAAVAAGDDVQGTSPHLVSRPANSCNNLLVFFAVGCVALPRVVTATRAGLKPAPTSHRALPTTKNPAQLIAGICGTRH